VEGQKTYVDLQNGFCFAYPERFSQGELNPGQLGIIGPGVDSTGAAPTAYLTIEVKDAPAGSDLPQVIDDFMSGLPAVRPTIEQYPFHLDDEQAMLLENVPGPLSSRRVLALHGDKLYNFTFSSSDLPEAQTDVAELFHMVISSFVFLARERGTRTSGGLAQWVNFKEGSFGLALPAGWTATLLPTPELPPGETPLGAQYELKPASYTGNSGSFVIIADAAQISTTQMVRRMCSGSCAGSPAPETVTVSHHITATRYAFPIGLGMGKQQIDHEWYFIEQEGKLIALSIVDPRTHLTLDDVLDTLLFDSMSRDGMLAPASVSQAAQVAMAADQSIDPATDRLYTVLPLSTVPAEWPDACLGVAVPDESCAQSVIPGYRVTLQLRHQALGGLVTCEYRSNEDGSLVLRTADACYETVAATQPVLAEVRMPAAGQTPGWILAIPAGWQQLNPELAWTPAISDGTRIGLNGVARTAGVEPTTILPNHAVMQGAQPVDLIWGDATAYTLEVSDSAAQGGQTVAIEKHIVVLTGDQVYDFYASAPTAAALATLSAPLERLLRLAVPLY
jgi:hypothetical protein